MKGTCLVMILQFPLYINILRGFTAYLKFCNFGDEINRHMKLNAWNETEGMKLKLPLDFLCE